MAAAAEPLALGCAAPRIALPLVRRLDWLAARAWPPLYIERQRGWLLRRNDGEFHRANSVLARHGWAGFAPDSAIADVEAHYTAAGLPPTWQISPASQPAGLDDRLAVRGYRLDDPVHILTRPLAGLDSVLPACGRTLRITTAGRASRAWLDTCWPADEHPGRRDNGARLLQRIRPATVFILASCDNIPAASGLVVAERGWAGVFCMRTAPRFRRRGAARAILRAAAEAAAALGGRQIYLQVEAANQPAIALYTTAGFAPAYGYHYRVADG